MTPDPLPPISSPPEHHWRQFRVNIIPGLTFVAVLAVTVWLWGKNLANPMVTGQAESEFALVTSPTPGRLAQLKVTLFQDVKAGDVVAVVSPLEPLVLSNTIAVARAEMNLIRVNAGLESGDRIRLADFKLSWMIQRAELVSVQAQLSWAKSEHERVRQLVADKILSPSSLETAERDHNQFEREVAEREQAVAAAEQAYRALDPASADRESPALTSAMAVAEQNLNLAEAQLQPVIITAPISGRVSKLDILPGAAVAEGAPIVTIVNPKPDRILGYLSQPLRIEPRIGMRAEIRSRGLVRRVGEAQVTQIGPDIETFDAPLRIRGMGIAQERGLPILMSVPPNLNIRPGEIVDIRLLVN